MSPDIDSIIQGAASSAGVDPDTLRAFAGIESGGNPNAVTGAPIYSLIAALTGRQLPGLLNGPEGAQQQPGQ